MFDKLECNKWFSGSISMALRYNSMASYNFS